MKLRYMRLIVAAIVIVIAHSAQAAELTEVEKNMVEYLDVSREEQFQFLEKIVNINSGTLNLEGVRQVGDIFAEELGTIGFETEWIDMPAEMERAGHLVASRTGNQGKCLLLLGHIDTVFQKDSPFQHYERVGNTIYGPGVYDMKGGDTVLLYALKAMHAAGQLENRCISVMLTGDEESSGRPRSESRGLMVEIAENSDAALSFEGGDGGGVTVARRASTSWGLEVVGRRDHSSLIFEEEVGAGAIFEAARILNTFYDEVRGEEYLVFNPYNAGGGTTVDISEDSRNLEIYGFSAVAQTFVVNGNMRFISIEQRDRAIEKMQEIVKDSLPHTSATLIFGSLTGTPMEPTDGNMALFEKVQQINTDLGYETPITINDPSRLGGGDIQAVASIVDSLDGLGTSGKFAHSVQEEMNVDNYFKELNRAALLIYRLTHGL